MKGPYLISTLVDLVMNPSPELDEIMGYLACVSGSDHACSLLLKNHRAVFGILFDYI